MGSSSFAVPILKELVLAGHNISSVYSQLPKPSGRGKKVHQNPIAKLALHYKLDHKNPNNLKDEKEIEYLRSLNLDIGVVASYGKILPPEMLELPKYGFINAHPSLLPRWRGAAPIQRAIMEGDADTGVCIMKMEKGLDTGAIFSKSIVPISSDLTAGLLHDSLSLLAGKKVVECLECIKKAHFSAQSKLGVTYAEKISKSETRIDWNLSSDKVDAKIRGLSPYPGAWSEINGARIKFLNSKKVKKTGLSGTILEINKDSGMVIIGCGDESVGITLLQRSGKKVMSATNFFNGFDLGNGTNFS